MIQGDPAQLNRVLVNLLSNAVKFTRTIVGNHGRQVRLESREGEGARVTVRLPLLANGGRDEG